MTLHAQAHADAATIAAELVRSIAHGELDAAHVCTSTPELVNVDVTLALIDELAAVAAVAVRTVAALRGVDVDDVVDVFAADVIERYA